MSTSQRPQLYHPGLKSTAYEHPEDRRLLASVKAIKGFDQLLKAFFALGIEPVQYAQNLTDNVRVTPRQYPRLYAMFKRAVKALDVPEPELFVDQQRDVNAYTSGTKHPYVVVHAGLLETFTEDEILFVLAHELGHIKSGHVLYMTLSRFLADILSASVGNIPFLGPAIIQGLQLGFLRWSRQAEFTADRAGHLVVNDSDVAVGVMLKLAGGFALREAPNVAEFLKQAEDYHHVERSAYGKAALVVGGSLFANHPYPVIRARELQRWHVDPAYHRIVAGQDDRDMTVTFTLPSEQLDTARLTGPAVPEGKAACPVCTASHDSGDMYCASCGERLKSTYFAVKERPVAVAGAGVSSLRGGLGEAVNEALMTDEVIVFEVEGPNGEGFTCTSQRILISKAGLTTAGGLRARKVGSFPLTDIHRVDMVVGSRFIRIQVGMPGFPALDQEKGWVETQYPTLLRQLNVCHVLPDKQGHVEAFLHSFRKEDDATPDLEIVFQEPQSDRRAELDALLQAGILTAEEHGRAVGRVDSAPA